jgi:serine/threonine protein kinase
VRVFDFDIEDHTPFLVMDCLPNGSVRHSHPRGTPLPLSTILSYVKQVASALQYAHDEKLIHRDVKPENMLLDKGDTIVLSDFGIALMAQSSLYQNTQEVAGTAAYMAPEQFQGKPRRASDQYALGVVVYEWLSGERPFHGSFSEIASQHLFVPPPPLDKKVPTITPEVEQVVLMALEKDPHKRFASVQEFATVLEQACQSATTHPATLLSKGTSRKWPSPPANTAVEILSSQLPQPKNAAALRKQPLQSTNVVTLPNRSSQSTGAVTPSSTPTVMHSSTGESMLTDKSRRSPGHFSRRTVVEGLVGVAGLVIVGGGLTWLAGSRSSFSPAAIPSPIPTSKSTPTLATSPTPIPLGTSLLIYRGHSDWVGIVGWSHDGEHIASGSADKTVQVWDAATGTHVYTYRGHSGYIFALAWSPDGKRIASGGADQEVQVWDATTGGHILTHSYWAEANGVSWSPVGKRIASGGPDPIVPVRNVVQVWDAVTGDNILTYHGHSGSLFAVAWSPDGKHIASGSAVPTVLVWDAVTGDTIYTYRGHFSTVCAVGTPSQELMSTLIVVILML